MPKVISVQILVITSLMLDSPFEGGTQPMPDPAYVRGTSLDAYASQVQQNQADNVEREKKRKTSND